MLENHDYNFFKNSGVSIPEQLREWAIRNKIIRVALRESLFIQRQISDLKDLPKDPRSFLQTYRKITKIE